MSRRPPPKRPEWSDEPVRLDWVDEATGLQCFMRRGMFDVWCGYIAVPAAHPWFGVDYSEIQGADVHGGLSYAAEAPDYPGLWSLGFDCGHAWDSWPGAEDRSIPDLPGELQKLMSGMQKRLGAKYRACEYVMLQCVALAEQAARAAAEFNAIALNLTPTKAQ